jgi:hypothetical protein
LFEGVGEEALFDAIEASMAVPSRGQSGFEGASEGGPFKPCGHIAALQASDRLEQVWLPTCMSSCLSSLIINLDFPTGAVRVIQYRIGE